MRLFKLREVLLILIFEVIYIDCLILIFFIHCKCVAILFIYILLLLLLLKGLQYKFRPRPLKSQDRACQCGAVYNSIAGKCGQIRSVLADRCPVRQLLQLCLAVEVVKLVFKKEVVKYNPALVGITVANGPCVELERSRKL